MEGIKDRIDVVIDSMNTLRYLAELDVHSNPERISPDVRDNDVLVYDNLYMWELCEALDRVPDITPIEPVSSVGHEFRVTMYYRGTEFHTYITRDDKAFFEDKIVEYLAKKEQEAQAEVDDNV